MGGSQVRHMFHRSLEPKGKEDLLRQARGAMSDVSWHCLFARCRKSKEQHYKRHREIASIIQNIHEWDAGNEFMAPKRGRRKTNDFVAPSGGYKGSSAYQAPNIVSPKGKKERKLAKRAEKQRNRLSSLGVSSAAVDDVDRILHPPASEPLAGKTNAQNSERFKTNISYSAAVNPYYELPDSLRAITAEEKRSEEQIALPENVLSELGVEMTKGTSRERKVLISKLTEAIIHDLTVADNEGHEAEVRRSGYWRYVHRGTKKEMDRTAEEWVWGEGKKTVAAGEDILTGEEEERSDTGTWMTA
ncbi:hypothetical protein FGG08_003767 [Glutinoglossum americanum]|uniref:Uncharacterized protein n=1 Tax=Glutinoglossum americanum TaxID=1670608 RepID=A0A9P8HXP7_9PEZI|nr:hypothetical protein FGG08_003767 [Glutinoglossum americanum]